MSSEVVNASLTGDENREPTMKGIPKAVFIEDVDEYLKNNGYSSIKDAMMANDQLYQKYKLMEQAFLQRKLRLLQQMPDITKTLDVVNHLEKKNENFDVTFEVADQLFARAHIDKADKVNYLNGVLIFDIMSNFRFLVVPKQPLIWNTC